MPGETMIIIKGDERREDSEFPGTDRRSPGGTGTIVTVGSDVTIIGPEENVTVNLTNPNNVEVDGAQLLIVDKDDGAVIL